jgi:photosystem II stability/assembly factor-like uncharacterized protein
MALNGYKYHIAAMLGSSLQTPALSLGVIGYDIDTKTFRVGDDTSTPPKVPTNKSSGSFEFPNITDFKLRNLSLYTGGKIDGVEPKTMVKAAGFAYHLNNGQFGNVSLQSPNGSITIGSPSIDPLNPSRLLVNLSLKQAFVDILNSGFNLGDVQDVDDIPNEEGDPIIHHNNTYYIWNTENNTYNPIGIPVLSDNIPSVPGPQMFIDASDDDNRKLRMWSGTAYIAVGGGNEVYIDDIEPVNPIEGSWWRQPSLDNLKARIDNNWLDIEFSSDTSETTLVKRALWESWRLNDEGYAWDFFVSNPRYNQRSFEAMAVGTTSGDDTITVPNSYPFEVGSTYAIFTDEGLVEEVTILNKPSSTTLRITSTFGTTYTIDAGAKIGPTSFDIKEGYAEVKGDQVYIAEGISVLRKWNKGIVLIRRDAYGTGLFQVYYRETGTDTWVKAKILNTQGVAHEPEWSEELYSIPVNRKDFDVRVFYEGDPEVVEKVKYFAFYTDPEQSDDLRVDKPVNVSPANLAVNISQTPTLTLSDFLSLYGISQGGAHFQISNDSRFFDVVIDTSTEPLISWEAVSGQSAAFTDALMYDDRKGVLVGDAAVILTTDNGGKTFTTRTSAIDTKDINALGWNYSNRIYAVGDSGSIQHTVDYGVNWVQAAGVDGFTDNLYGVAAADNYGVAVGDDGTILTSTNNGVIWVTATNAGSYTGTFYAVSMTSNGKAIAVGTDGEIQTSPDYGVTWVSRTPAGSFSGTFYAVAIDDNGYAVAVGTDGEIQTSSDYGSTWVSRDADDSYTGAFRAVKLRGTTVVAVGANGEIQTSENRGQTWISRPPAGASTATMMGIALNTSDDYAFIVGSGGTVQHTQILEGEVGDSYSVPQGSDLLQNNRVYYWRGRMQDSLGFWSEWSEPTAFATSAVFRVVDQPSNVLPANDATNVKLIPTLVSSPFVTGSENPDTHDGSQWQVSATPDFTSTVYDSGEVTDLLTHTLPSALTAFATLYWRVRHYGAIVGPGPWSIPTKFRVSSVPSAPTIINPVNSSVNNSVAPLLRTSEFSNVDPGVTHYATQWQVSTTSNFSNIVYDPGAITGSTPRQITMPNGVLSSNTLYYVRARHKGISTEWSPWSTTVVFTTNAVGVSTPTISYTGLIPSEIVLRSSAFGLFGTGAQDTHATSDWEIYKISGASSTLVYSAYNSPNKTSITVAKTDISGGELSSGEFYRARVRHTGTGYGNSSYSAYAPAGEFTFPAPVGVAEYTTPGNYNFIVPDNVFSVSVVVVGAGSDGTASRAGSGGALAYKNSIAVTPGQTIPVSVGGRGSVGGLSSFGNLVSASGGTTNAGGTPTGHDGGGAGGIGGNFITGYGGGGGSAGRYNSAGGNGVSYTFENVTTPVVTTTSNVVQSLVSTEYFGSGGGGYPTINENPVNSGDQYGVGPYPSTYITWSTFTYRVENNPDNQGFNQTGYIKTTYRWDEIITENTTYVDTTVYSNTESTGTAGLGRGGQQGLIGEGIGLLGSNVSPSTGYGAGGAAPSGLGTSGAVRVIWGAGKVYPTNAV